MVYLVAMLGYGIVATPGGADAAPAASGAGIQAANILVPMGTSTNSDVTITKTPSADTVARGSSVTYTYTIKNNTSYRIWSRYASRNYGTVTDDKRQLPALGAANWVVLWTTS